MPQIKHRVITGAGDATMASFTYSTGATAFPLRPPPPANTDDLLLEPPGPPPGKETPTSPVSMLFRNHPLPCLFALSLLFFMAVEYTLAMVPPTSPPFDIGFLLTEGLHEILAGKPAVNSFMAGVNTAFVGAQAAYILWVLVVEGRPRPTVAALFMFTCRGVLGCATQLPLPQGYLGSGVDFPVGNVSFFLFFSGHVAGAVIASLDMRRMNRQRLAWAFDALNAMQALRLLISRGHYTIDLAVGAGAGILFDYLAGMYHSYKIPAASDACKSGRPCCGCRCK
ncbi:hypothetical protein AXF42_Ash011801 [Apostasia shenzhenica]|uniref:AtPDCT1/2 transmembrane domain-containing protein n=1 Tax=Apostasia shenzhenica TaxID=1088818 RepID=A0A2I0AVW2_9ASPA|nr:hypothetical protein AXF42_Ash011801 [Apostasia shenzhenica]